MSFLSTNNFHSGHFANNNFWNIMHFFPVSSIFNSFHLCWLYWGPMAIGEFHGPLCSTNLNDKNVISRKCWNGVIIKDRFTIWVRCYWSIEIRPWKYGFIWLTWSLEVRRWLSLTLKSGTTIWMNFDGTHLEFVGSNVKFQLLLIVRRSISQPFCV